MDLQALNKVAEAMVTPGKGILAADESTGTIEKPGAVANGTVYQSFLNRPPCNSKAPPGRLEGEVIAFASGFGKIRWRTRIGPTESSPLVADGRVYVGDWRGRVYALDAATGKVRWTFQGKGRIKGGIAKSGNRLFFGTYDGYLYAIRADDGKIVWRTRSQDRLGGRGDFYSTPAVAFGRVYLGWINLQSMSRIAANLAANEAIRSTTDAVTSAREEAAQAAREAKAASKSAG